MREEDRPILDRSRMRSLLGELGALAAAQDKVIEIAVYGGSALVLQFDFREGSEDVDYIPLRGDNGLLKRLADVVAERHGLTQGWIRIGRRAADLSQQRRDLPGPGRLHGSPRQPAAGRPTAGAHGHGGLRSAT